MYSNLYLVLLTLMVFMGACGPSIPDDWFDNSFNTYGHYSQEAVNYFLEVGLCSEFEVCTNPTIKKWTSDVRIQINGSYNSADENELDEIISELSELTGLSIKKVTRNANITIYFIKQNQFKKYIPNYNTNNPQDGVFETRYQGDSIIKATICIEDHLLVPKRHHLLREELTQTMGLQKDSYSHTKSIFQQDPKYTPTEYLQIDKEVIRILYDRKIRPGMSQAEIKQALIITQVVGN